MSVSTLIPHHTSPPYRSLILDSRCMSDDVSSYVPCTSASQDDNSYAKMLAIHHRGSLKSKYSSLVRDVNVSITKRIHPKPHHFIRLTIASLPAEVIDRVIYFVTKIEDLRACLYVNKLFYNCAKPYFYANIAFTSTYRLAQFVTYLRLNPSVGEFVRLIDLSSVMLGIDEAHRRKIAQPNQPLYRLPVDLPRSIDENLGEIDSNNNVHAGDNDDVEVSAGWRDWKLKGTPLYSFQHLSSRRSVVSTQQIAHIRKRRDSRSSKSLSSLKSSTTLRSIAKRSFKQMLGPFYNAWFKGIGHDRKDFAVPRSPPVTLQLSRTSAVDSKFGPETVLLHPASHKLLLSYSSTRDIPLGYAIHIVMLCPNLEKLNLAGVNLSADYVIDRSKASRFRTYDLMSHYPKNLAPIIHSITMRLSRSGIRAGLSLVDKLVTMAKSHSCNVWSQSSMATSFVPTVAKMQYTSLLPPLESAVLDTSCLSDPATRIYLSDLSSKSINNSYLRKTHEQHLLKWIANMHWETAIYNRPDETAQGNLIDSCRGSLRLINLLSMVWLNQSLARQFLMSLVDNGRLATNSKFHRQDSHTIASSIGEHDQWLLPEQKLIVDFSNSGMRKNLAWAQRIDMRTSHGRELATRLVNGEPIDATERLIIDEARRQGRVGENYAS